MTGDKQDTGHTGHAGSPSAAAAARAWSRLAELARVSSQTQSTLTKQSVELAWATLARDLDRISANRAYVESVSREVARYWGVVGELVVAYATDLADLGKSLATMLIDERRPAPRPPSPSPSRSGRGGSGRGPARG